MQGSILGETVSVFYRYLIQEPKVIRENDGIVLALLSEVHV